jgi:hypothetical protein
VFLEEESYYQQQIPKISPYRELRECLKIAPNSFDDGISLPPKQ